MKRILPQIIFLASFQFVFAQSSTKLQSSSTGSQNFYEVRDAFLKYYDQNEASLRKEEDSQGEDERSDGLLDKFRRWQFLMEQRTFPTGKFPDPSITWKEWAKYKKAHPDEGTMRSANWTQVGTNVVPSNGGGAGRINVVRFDPNNSNIIYIGTASGGVWKSIDGGIKWNTTTDQIPVLSIADIAIDPLNTNNVFVATGDGYGYEFGSDNDFWGGLYSAGVIVSHDGGATWATTGYSIDQASKNIIQRLIINPANPQILLAATRTGIYRTADGGANWTSTLSYHIYDLEFNAADPNIIYAGGNGEVYKSTDGGVSWNSIKSGLGTGRISIETSAANSQVIYALSESGTFVKSTDGGATWVNKTSPSSIAGFYGYYDLVLDCSNDNSDYLLAGGLNTAKSTNGGTSWSGASNTTYGTPNYVHADNHAMLFLPGNTSTYFAAGDGGIFKTTNSGANWTDLSNGLMIAQLYRLASGVTDPNIIYSGWQDNGSNKWDGNTNTWKQVYGADGMDCMVDYTTTQVVYTSYQYGALQRSINGGTSFTYIAPATGAWITPYVMHPTDHLTIYAAYASIYKSTNQGTSWINIGSNQLSTASLLTSMSVAPSNAGYIYISDVQKIKVTANGGNTWNTITGTLPVSSCGIENETVSYTDPLHVWVCMSGYSDGNKVFESTNGGATWTNVSGSLPNLPVNAIVFEKNSPDRVYVGTDIGVYYRDDNTSDWVYYSDELPSVMVDWLEINYTSNKLLAATYGRGMWQADLAGNPLSTLSTNPVLTNPLCPNTNLNVNYVASGPYYSGNVFTAQLSDATGNFSSPTSLGSVSATTSGIIACTIPSTTSSGNAYRIRVVSSNPTVTGTDNGSNLTITCPVPAGLAATNITSNSATLMWTGNSCALNYRVRYKEVSAGPYTTVWSSGNSKNISGLFSNTQYKWSVKTKCVQNPVMWSAWSADAFFNTSGGKILLNDQSPSGFEIYPNPSPGNFVLKISGSTSSIEIFNLVGQKIWSSCKTFQDQNVSVNLTTQPGGIYFVKVKVSGDVITKQVTVE